MYEDKKAWAALDILGVHQYDTQRAEPWPDYVAKEDRKPVWQTEMSGVKWWPEQGAQHRHQQRHRGRWMGFTTQS